MKKSLVPRSFSEVGFTLIEFLVITVIVLIFSGISLARYNDFTQQLRLKNEAKKLVDVLELSKKKSLTADLFDKNCTNFSGYRTILAETSYTMNFCCLAVCTNVSTYNLSTGNTVTSGLGNYDFTPLMINPVFAGNSVRIKNSIINKCIDINISAIGIFEINETLVSC